MRTINNYIGIEPFTVLVDDSPKLRELSKRAKELKDLPFLKKLEAVKRLSLESMVNAYEQMIVYKKNANSFQEQANKFKDIVFQQHPLSYALKHKAGCCRYQGALFFVLSYNAELGDKHFVQAAPVNNNVNTVFNELVEGEKHYKVSIFTDSLEDKSLDYSRENPEILNQAFKKIPGYDFFSYHKTANGLVMIANPNQHIKTLEK